MVSTRVEKGWLERNNHIAQTRKKHAMNRKSTFSLALCPFPVFPLPLVMKHTHTHTHHCISCPT